MRKLWSWCHATFFFLQPCYPIFYTSTEFEFDDMSDWHFHEIANLYVQSGEHITCMPYMVRYGQSCDHAVAPFPIQILPRLNAIYDAWHNGHSW